MSALVQILAPVAEPVSVSEGRLHVRQTIEDDDDIIMAMITVAREQVETLTRRALVVQRWKLVLDAFPGVDIVVPKPPLVSVVSITYTDTDGVQQTLASTKYQVDTASEPARIVPAYGEVWPTTRSDLNAVEITFLAGYAARITADKTADTIAISGWKTLAVGDTVSFSNSGGALPPPLLAGTIYYVRSVVSAGVYTLSATSGGSLLDITGEGFGTNFLGAVPEGIKNWIKLRLGSLYEFREDVAILDRGRIDALPYVDGLLDPYRVLVF